MQALCKPDMHIACTDIHALLHTLIYTSCCMHWYEYRPGPVWRRTMLFSGTYHSMPARERAPRINMDLLNLSVFLLCLAILNIKPMAQTAKFSTRMMNM